MKVVNIYHRPSWLGGNLNLRQLLNRCSSYQFNVILIASVSARLGNALCRELKARSVPLCQVDPTVYLERRDPVDGRVYVITTSIKTKKVKK